MTDTWNVAQSKEEILSKIQEDKKARYQRQWESPARKKLTAAILNGMMDDPNRIYTSIEIEVFAELAGISYLNVPPLLTYLVAQGLIQRPRHGYYRLPRAERTGVQN